MLGLTQCLALAPRIGSLLASTTLPLGDLVTTAPSTAPSAMTGAMHGPGTLGPATQPTTQPLIDAATAAGGALVDPMLVLILCVIAGIGTLLLLPGQREAMLRKLGGVVALISLLLFGALLARNAAADSGAGVGVYFWIFSAIALIGAARVVTHPKPVYSALYFVLTVFASAGLFILLWAEFMAAALILIYAGAILITYVFVIMLASQASSPPVAGKPMMGLADYDNTSREPMVAAAVGFTLMGILLFLIFDKGAGLTAPRDRNPYGQILESGAILSVNGGTQKLGVHLFQDHVVNLELAGLILTISMVGAIVIARRQVAGGNASFDHPSEVFVAPHTPVDDNPHSIPVFGTDNPRQKAYPET